MDPVALIVTALAAGTTLGRPDIAATAVQDAYARLWARVRKRLADRPDGAMVLARHAEAPHTWEAPLSAALAAAGAARDDGLIVAATALLSLTDEPGFRSGKYVLDAPDLRSMPVGEHRAPPPSAQHPSTQPNSLNGQCGY